MKDIHPIFPSALRAIEFAARRPAVCFIRRDDEKPGPGGMIVRQSNTPAAPSKSDSPRGAAEIIAEMAEKQKALMAKPVASTPNEEEWDWEYSQEMVDDLAQQFNSLQELSKLVVSRMRGDSLLSAADALDMFVSEMVAVALDSLRETQRAVDGIDAYGYITHSKRCQIFLSQWHGGILFALAEWMDEWDDIGNL